MKFKKLKKFITAICLFLVIIFAVGSVQDVLVTRSEIDSQFIPPLLSPLVIYFSRRILGNLNTIFEWQYNEMKNF